MEVLLASMCLILWFVYKDSVLKLTYTPWFKRIYPRIAHNAGIEILVLTALGWVAGAVWAVALQLVFAFYSWNWQLYIGASLVNWYLLLNASTHYSRRNLK